MRCAGLPLGQILIENRLGAIEFDMRLVPVFECGFDQAAPIGGVAVGVEGGAGNVVMRVAIAAHHVVGRGAHGLQLLVALQRGIERLHQVDEAERFGGKSVGEIEARQNQARMVGVFRLQPCGGRAQAAFGRKEAAARGTSTSSRNPGTRDRRHCAVSAAGESATGMVGGVSARPPAWVIGHARAVDGDAQIVDIGRKHQARRGL